MTFPVGLVSFVTSPKVWLISGCIAVGAGLAGWALYPQIKALTHQVKQEKSNVKVEQTQTTQAQTVGTALTTGERKIGRARTGAVVAKAAIAATPPESPASAAAFWDGLCASAGYANKPACTSGAYTSPNPGDVAVPVR